VVFSNEDSEQKISRKKSDDNSADSSLDSEEEFSSDDEEEVNDDNESESESQSSSDDNEEEEVGKSKKSKTKSHSSSGDKEKTTDESKSKGHLEKKSEEKKLQKKHGIPQKEKEYLDNLAEDLIKNRDSEIDLSGQRFTDKKLGYFLDILSKEIHLQKEKISEAKSIKEGEESSSEKTEPVPQMPSGILLKLNKNLLSKEGYKKLFEFIIQNPDLISYINISQTTNAGEVVEALLVIGEENPNGLVILFQRLKYIWLAETGMNDEVVKKLINILRKAQEDGNILSIQGIDLSKNNITDVQPFVGIVKNFEEIRCEIILTGNPLSPESINFLHNKKGPASKVLKFEDSQQN
jgi:hypothetical protein